MSRLPRAEIRRVARRAAWRGVLRVDRRSLASPATYARRGRRLYDGRLGGNRPTLGSTDVRLRESPVRATDPGVQGAVRRTSSGVEPNALGDDASHLGEHWLLFIASGPSLTCYRIPTKRRRRSSPDDRRFRACIAVSSLRRSLPQPLRTVVLQTTQEGSCEPVKPSASRARWSNRSRIELNCLRAV